MNAMVDAWAGLVFHGAWQAAVVAAAILIAVRLGHRWPAPVRYGLLLVALAKFALPPVLALPTGAFSHWGPEVAHVKPDVVVPAVAELQLGTVEPVTAQFEAPPWKEAAPSLAMPPAEPVEMASKMSVVASSARNAPWDWRTVLLALHLSGTAIVAGWLGVQWIRLRRLQASAVEVSGERVRQRFDTLAKQLGIRRSVRLLVGDDDTVPCSFGLVRPLVVVSVSLVSEPSEDLDRVLAHELAHHRRGDLWVNAAQLVLFTVWWFHPLYWLLHRSLRAVREDCCDDLLLAKGIAMPGEYCDTILRVASNQRSTGPLAIASSMADYPHPLEKRFRRIMDGSLRRSVRLGWLGLAAVVVLAAVLLPGARSETDSHPIEAQDNTRDDEARARSTEQDEKPEERRIIKGRVVDETGAPVADADVWCPVKYLREGVEDLTLHVKSDRDGEFRMTVPAEWLPDPFVISYHWMLWAYAEGRQIGTASPTWGPLRVRRENREIEIVLGPQTDVAIRLQRADGEVAAGAKVLPREYEMRPSNRGRFPEELARRLASRTDEAGLVKLPWLGRDKSGAVLVETESLGQQLVSFSRKQGQWNARLLPTGRLEGRIVAPVAEHAAGVRLYLKTTSTPGTDMLYVKGTCTVETDRDGRFSVDHLAKGKLQVRGRLREDVPWRLRLRDDVEVVAGKRVYLSLNAEPAVRVEGRVIEKGSGKPIRGVTMSVQYGIAAESDHAVTDDNGRYSAYALPGEVRLQMVNYPPPFMQTGGSRRVQRFYVSDDVAPFTFPTLEVEKYRHVSGTLIDGRGRPIPRVNLVASPHSASLTDDAGSFELVIPLISDVSEIEFYVTIEKDERSSVKVVQSDPLVLRVGDTAETPSEASSRDAEDATEPEEQVRRDSATEGRSNETPRLGEPRTIVGRVVDKSGKPVAGAKLWLPVRWTPEGWLAAKGTADDRGKFQIEVHGEWMTEPKIYDYFPTIWAYAPEHRIAIASAREGLFGEAPEPVEVVVGAEVKTSVRVLKPDGSPAVGATVEPYHFRGTMGYEIMPEELVAMIGAITDESGLARLPALPIDGLHNLEIEAQGFGRQRIQTDPTVAEDVPWKIELRTAGRVVGQIAADDPKVAAGIRLSLVTEGEFEYPRTTMPPWLTEGRIVVITDEQGRFAVDHLAEGHLQIRAKLPDEGAMRLSIPEWLEVVGGDTTEVTLEVRTGVLLAGTVQEQGTGKPIVGAQVDISHEGQSQTARVTTDDKGRYSAYALPGNAWFQVFAKGYTRTRGESRQSLVEIPDDADQFEIPAFELVPTREVLGRLIDHGGRSVSNVHLEGNSGDEPHGLSSMVATVEENGTFRLSVPQDVALQEMTFVVSGVGSQPTKAAMQQEEPLVLRLSPPLTEMTGTVLVGRVIDEHGKPVEDATFQLSLRRDENDRGSTQLRIDPSKPAVRTDGAGRFRFPELLRRDWEYQVSVESKLHELINGTSQWGTANGSETDLGDIVVERIFSVRGQVVDEDSEPISGAVVTLRHHGEPMPVGVSDEEGRFAFPRVFGGGRFDISVMADGYGLYDELTEFTEEDGKKHDGGPRIVLHRTMK